jgi:hypothetical protein
MEKREKVILNTIAVFFILIVVAKYIQLISIGEINGFFWYCYIGMIVMAIAIFRKNSFMLVTQMNLLLIPTILWVFDFIYFVLTKQYLIGVSSPFFTSFLFSQKLLSMEHIFLPIFSLIALYIIKIDKNKIKFTFLISILEGYLIFFVTRIISSPAENINCVYKTCLNFNLPFYYPIHWTLIMIPSTITGFLLIYYIKGFHKNKLSLDKR